MTSIEEALRSGAVRLVPVEATDEMEEAGGSIEDTEHGGVHGYVSDVWSTMLSAAPDHTPALLALIEERDRLKVERDTARAGRAEAERENKRLDRELTAALAGQVANVVRREEANAYGDAEHARALAAEAKCDALREALAPFGSGAVVFYENEPDDCVLSLGRWKYQEDGRARFYADVQFTVADVRRARARTQETNDGE